jgi:hypothetical protein
VGNERGSPKPSAFHRTLDVASQAFRLTITLRGILMPDQLSPEMQRDVTTSTRRKKLSPEESIAKAEARLARAKQKAAEEADRAKQKARAEARDASFAKRRKAMNFADDIVERVEDEVVATHFPTVPAFDDDDDYDYRSPEHVAHILAMHHAKGLDDDGYDPPAPATTFSAKS